MRKRTEKTKQNEKDLQRRARTNLASPV